MVKLMNGLPELLTFRELHEITKLNLTICVTNATTNQPIYFSNYFTPDFPVLEAVGASMNFPLAFKPTYNESNVLLYRSAIEQEGAIINPKFVAFIPHESDRRYYKEVFSMKDYNKYLAITLNYIKTKLALQISINNNLSFRSFAFIYG